MQDLNFGWGVMENGQIRPEFALKLPEKELKKRLRQRQKDLQTALAQMAMRYYGIK